MARMVLLTQTMKPLPPVPKQESLAQKMNISHWELTSSSRYLATGMLFLLQTAAGILGNFCLLYHYLILYFTKCTFRPTDLILMHLNVANTLVILSKGVPETMAAFGLKDIHSDIGCKLLFYFHKLGRDVSMGSTCLLSVFQVITISPRSSRWAELKGKAPKYLVTSSALCWVLNMVLNIVVPVCMTSKWNSKSYANKRDYGHCSAVLRDNVTNTLYIPLVLLRDILCLGLMLWSSSSMVFILYRHKRQMQHIHSSVSPRSSPESRAARSILVLVSTFVSLFSVSSIFHIALSIFKHPGLWLVNTSVLITGCFPALSPYILMSHDSRVSALHFVGIRNPKPTNVLNVL